MFEIHEFSVLTSTMKWLQERSATLNHGVACHALEQTQGKGRGGNKWVSSKGNLYLSVFLKPETQLNITDSGLFSFVMSLAIHETIEQSIKVQANVKIKWPNDILVNYKKISGLLLESSLKPGTSDVDHIIIGIGVNITSSPQLPDRETTYLNIYREKEIELSAFRDLLLTHVEHYYNRFIAEGFDPIRTTWLEKCCFLNEEIKVRISKDHQYQAIFRDLDRQGNLIVEDDQGQVHKVSSAEIFF